MVWAELFGFFEFVFSSVFEELSHLFHFLIDSLLNVVPLVFKVFCSVQMLFKVGELFV